ncbi:MAG: prepilin-type N-terminal cleavage/methylation domain-containing protein [Candidatus Hydrogenedentota bacterium]
MPSAPNNRRTPTSRSGFTLLELMIVMSLLAVITAMVTPVFRGTLMGIRAENEARNLAGLLEYAQARSITDAVEYRVYLAPTINTYWLERAVMREGRSVSFDFVEDMLIESTKLGDSLQLAKPRARRVGGESLYYVAFYPNGMCDEAVLGLRDLREDTVFVISTEGSKIRWAEEDA